MRLEICVQVLTLLLHSIYGNEMHSSNFTKVLSVCVKSVEFLRNNPDDILEITFLPLCCILFAPHHCSLRFYFLVK